MDNETQKGIDTVVEQLLSWNPAPKEDAVEIRKLYTQKLVDLLAAQETVFKERLMALVPMVFNGAEHTHIQQERTCDMCGWNACRQEVLTRIERLL